MQTKLLIAGSTLGICLLIAAGAVGYRFGHEAGVRDHALQIEQTRQAGESFQKAWHEGLDKAQAEQAERDRAAQKLHDLDEAEGKPARLQALEAKLDEIDYRESPAYKEGMATLPEDQRQKWDDDCRTHWEKAKADTLEQAARD